MTKYNRNDYIDIVDFEDLQEFFEHATYRDLLDLLLGLVIGKYTLENLKLDIDEYIRGRDD